MVGGVQRKSGGHRIASTHSSQESYLEHPTKVVSKSRKHSFSHFPKDRNCDVCLRTKGTRALCSRRTGDALPRAEKFGDLITADHKVLNEGGESRDNHRYAVVVKDILLLIGFSLIRVKRSLHLRWRKVFLKKFLEPSHRPKVVCTDNSMEFGKECED